jgi:hypothetical protein
LRCEAQSQEPFIFLTRNARAAGPREAARKIADARRKGHGLKVNVWKVESMAAAEMAGLVDSIVGWARHTLAGCRRPYGIDQFDLTLALAPGAGGRMRRLAFDRLRPMDLYQESFPERLASSLAREAGGMQALSVSAALFSWGEAAHRALPNRAEA